MPPRQSPPQPVTVERRRFAFKAPPCESCASSKTEVATLTDYVLYLRCWTCGHIWSVPKPGREQIRQLGPRAVIIEIPSTGEQIEAYIVADEPAAPLAVTFGPAGRARYTLAPMLNVGWRIMESTPAERAVLAAHGITQTDQRSSASNRRV